MRKKPKQARAAETVDTVLDAAAQVLQKEGEDGFTTNRVAEKAGFSIGTLYQYFPNKQAIIAALAERERAAIEARVRAAVEKAKPQNIEDVVREIIRALIGAFAGRRRLRRYIVLAAMRTGQIGSLLQAQQTIIDAVLESATRREDREAMGLRPLSPTMAFVMTRAVQGVVRSAVIEESDVLETREFEDELVRLVVGYLRG